MNKRIIDLQYDWNMILYWKYVILKKEHSLENSMVIIRIFVDNLYEKTVIVIMVCDNSVTL